MTNERIAPARSASRTGALLGSLLLALTVAFVGPVPVHGALTVAPTPGQPAATPSIQYEQALAHANDPNHFRPGSRATVPLRMRPAGSGSRQAAIGSVTAGDGSNRQGITPEIGTALNGGLRREVFGFLPYWELADSSAVINYSVLSTIAYFSVPVDRDGNLVKTNSDGTTSTGWGGWTSSALTNVINAAHQSGVRVVLCLTLFAWSSSDAATQSAFLGDAAARANLVTQAVQALTERGADGINLDFEPIAAGRAAEYTALVQAFRTQLDAVVPNAQLTFDTTAEIANYPIQAATAPGGADAIFVMGYDYRTGGAPNAGSIAPLNGPKYDIGDTLQAYLAQVPASKLILGLPWYGRAWSTVSDVPNAATQTGTKYGSSTAVFYSDAIDFANANGRRYDSVEESAWTAYQRDNCTSTYGCLTTWRELYYDDAQSLSAKYDLANSLGLRGVGMWALGYDGSHPELSQAIADKLSHDTTPPRAGIVALPERQPGPTFGVSWTAVDDWSGVVATDVQVAVDGGPWTDWLIGTTATSAVYSGGDGHTYAFRARSTDGTGNVGPWDVTDTGTGPPQLAPGSFARVVVDSLSVRAGPDTAAQRVAGVNTGTLLAITGGPVSAGGFTWYRVTEPILEWDPVSQVLTGVWVASGSGGTPYIVPARAPNSTALGQGAGGPIDTQPPSLEGVAVNRTVFSPNGDGRLDDVTVSAPATGATAWQLTAAPVAPDGMAGPIVRTIAGTGAPVTATWDGHGEGGSILPDGVERLTLTLSDAAGNLAVASFDVTIDTTPPAGSPTVSAAIFSPNGDGWLETTSLAWSLAEPVTGSAVVTRGAATVRSWPIAAGTAGALSWDGRDAAGRGVADGRFAWRLTIQDAAGNQVVRSVVVTVDRSAAMLRWSPGSVKRAASSVVSYQLAQAATVSLVIRDATGKTIRSAFGGRAQRAGRQSWSWNGRTAAGKPVQAGRYLAVLTVKTGLGTSTIMRTLIVK